MLSLSSVFYRMKIFFVVALAFVSVEASAKFKTANEFTGLRSLLSEWQPANSLKLLDFIGTSFDAVVVRSANETFIDKYIQTVRDSFSEKTGAAASEYDKDLESRRKALTPDALKFLNRQKATFMDFLKRDVAVKWVMSLAEYANQPKAVKESLLASYPSTFGIYEKVAVALKDDA